MELMKTPKKNLIQNLSALKTKKRAHLEKKELMDKMVAMEVTGRIVRGIRLAMGAMEGMQIKSKRIYPFQLKDAQEKRIENFKSLNKIMRIILN